MPPKEMFSPDLISNGEMKASQPLLLLVKLFKEFKGIGNEYPQTQRNPTRHAGAGDRKTQPAQRQAERGNGGTHIDQQPQPPARHQGEIDGWAGGTGAGNPYAGLIKVKLFQTSTSLSK